MSVNKKNDSLYTGWRQRPFDVVRRNVHPLKEEKTMPRCKIEVVIGENCMVLKVFCLWKGCLVIVNDI